VLSPYWYEVIASHSRRVGCRVAESFSSICNRSAASTALALGPAQDHSSLRKSGFSLALPGQHRLPQSYSPAPLVQGWPHCRSGAQWRNCSVTTKRNYDNWWAKSSVDAPYHLL
jgi:hypothetical protein